MFFCILPREIFSSIHIEKKQIIMTAESIFTKVFKNTSLDKNKNGTVKNDLKIRLIKKSNNYCVN